MRREQRDALAPLLLDADAVAAFLSISRRSVWQLAASGDLRRVRLGPRSTRFRRDDLEKLIDSRTLRG